MWLAGSGHYIVKYRQTVNNSTFWHANRLQTHQLNPTSIQPTLILAVVFFFPLDSFFLLSLKGNSAVWWMSGLSDPPDSLELPSHFAELRAKYTESTQSFAALIPRKWNFTPKPKQTRPHIFFTRLQWAQSEQKVPISSAHSNNVFKKSKLLIRQEKKKVR